MLAEWINKQLAFYDTGLHRRTCVSLTAWGPGLPAPTSGKLVKKAKDESGFLEWSHSLGITSNLEECLLRIPFPIILKSAARCWDWVNANFFVSTWFHQSEYSYRIHKSRSSQGDGDTAGYMKQLQWHFPPMKWESIKWNSCLSRNRNKFSEGFLVHRGVFSWWVGSFPYSPLSHSSSE